MSGIHPSKYVSESRKIAFSTFAPLISKKRPFLPCTDQFPGVHWQDIVPFLVKYMKDSQHILHIGAGNSLLAEQILGDDRFPSRLSIENVDVSSVAVDRMNDHLDSIFGPVDATPAPTTGKSKKSSEKKTKLRKPPGNRLWTREQICYVRQDVRNMTYEDESVDIVLDKGMLDAVLSHGEVETGESELVKQVNREVFRVLKPKGYYIVFSGMDNFITGPYFFGDEDVDWADVNSTPFQSRSPSNKTLRTIYCYVLMKGDASSKS